jgi:hypothetical protein
MIDAKDDDRLAVCFDGKDNTVRVKVNRSVGKSKLLRFLDSWIHLRLMSKRFD